jgi:GT2 family glycosyltransferase
MKLSIIVLSYNTKDLLQDCLQSIYDYLPEDFFEVIALDNASTDESVEVLSQFKTHHENFILIKNKENTGFGKGINQAAKVAKGEYLLFLNSDATLQDDSLKTLIELADKQPKAGIVGGQLLNFDKTPQRSAGKFYTLTRVFLMLLRGDGAATHSNGRLQAELIATDWVSGGFMVIRKNLFDNLNGFDERFFMYMEDMELCYRVREMGYNVYTYPGAVAIHANHGSSNRSFAIQHIYKGLLYFFEKHRRPWERTILKVLLFGKALSLVGIGIITRNGYLKRTYGNALKLGDK